MILSAEIIIEREGSQFPVTVLRGSTCLGYYDHPEGPHGDRKYDLTEAEQDEALAILNAEDDPKLDCEPDEPVVTGKDADRAADAYFGHRSANR